MTLEIDVDVARALLRLVFTFGKDGTVVGPSFALPPITSLTGVADIIIRNHIDLLVEKKFIVYSNRIKSNREPQFATLEPTTETEKWASRLFPDPKWTDVKEEFYEALSTNPE